MALLEVDLLRRIASHVRCRALLADLVASLALPPSKGQPTAQLAFRFGQRAPPRGPLIETDLVVCDHYRCTLPLRTCLARQLALWPGKRAGVHPYCASGDCEQGADYGRRSEWDPRAVWSKGRFSFYRPGSREQHAARKRLGREVGAARWTDAEELTLIGQGAVTARARGGT